VIGWSDRYGRDCVLKVRNLICGCLARLLITLCLLYIRHKAARFLFAFLSGLSIVGCAEQQCVSLRTSDVALGERSAHPCHLAKHFYVVSRSDVRQVLPAISAESWNALAQTDLRQDFLIVLIDQLRRLSRVRVHVSGPAREPNLSAIPSKCGRWSL
jgi:hypothetical protein